MNRSLLTKTVLPILLAVLFLAPFYASAQTSSGVTSWFSHILNWQTSLASQLSGMFEARKDSVESNSIARNQLLDWRRGIVSIDTSDTSSTSPLDSSSTDDIVSSSTDSDLNASSSPLFISLKLFEEKKAAITVELLTAENDLKVNESQLAGIISSKVANGDDMSAAQTSLDQANVNIELADQTISTFENYEPDISNSSNEVNLQIPESNLEAAVKSIQTARTSLTSAITEIENPLQ